MRMYKAKKMINKIKLLYLEKKYARRSNKVKKTLAACGENLQVFGKAEISFPQNLKVGNNFKLNSNVYINARSGVTIGDDVTLSYGVKVISTGYDIEHWMKTGEKLHITDKPIHIGNHCWIGAGATILPGVSITGEFVVIAADSVVTKNITESKVVLAGSPAKIIKQYK